MKTNLVDINKKSTEFERYMSLKKRMVELLFEIDEVSCKLRLIYENKYNTYFKDILNELKKAEQKLELLKVKERYITKCTLKDIVIDEGELASIILKTKEKQKLELDGWKLYKEHCEKMSKFYDENYKIYCCLNGKHKEFLNYIYPITFIKEEENLNELIEREFQAYCENDYMLLSALDEGKEEVLNISNNLSENEISKYIQAQEIEFFKWSEYLFDLKAKEPYCYRYHIEDEEWREKHKDELIKRKESLELEAYNLENQLKF